jgi:hypothetical protein
MPDQRFEFAWRVPTSGYCWVAATRQRGDGPKHTGPALLAAALVDPAVADFPTFFSPEPDELLFRVFGELRADEESILAFANRYGDLGSPDELSLARRGKFKHHTDLFGTFLDTWQWHVAEVRRLTALWDLVHRGGEESLGRHIRWARGPSEGWSVYFDRHAGPVPENRASLAEGPGSELIASSASDPGLLGTFRPGDVLKPALAYLKNRLDPCLNRGAEYVTVGMSWDPRREHPALAYHCPTLLAAVWLGLATSVSENIGHGKCPTCGKWFAVAQGAFRSSRMFCSTGCRSRAYRQRQETARRLYTSGKSFEAIAEELDSDVATVRKWVTGFK